MNKTEKQRTASFLRPEHIAPIHNLNLRAKLIVEGTIAGIHRSPYHGFSAEFFEYRQYRPGEATRFIDWRKFARSDRAVVRLFEDETNLYAHLLLDKSASMRFQSSAPMSKFDYGRTLCAALAWILIRQRDSVGLAAFDQEVRTYMPPRSTNVQLKSIINRLDHTEAGEKTRCGTAIEWMAGLVAKRGMCVIISDMFDDIEAIVHGLRHLRFKRQDVIVLWVVDPLEREFAYGAPLRIHDLETDERIELDPRVAATYYSEGFNRHREELERACSDLRVDLDYVYTDEPFQKALLRVLQKRGRLF